MGSLTIVLIIILAAIVLASPLSRWLKLPIVVVEMIIGIILGHLFLDIVLAHPLIEFFSTFGLIYLMFLAGLEINFSAIKEHFFQTSILAFFSLVFAFAAGAFIAPYLGLHPLFVGVLLSTTSLGLILPLTREFEEGHRRFSHILFGSVVIVDIASIFILALVLGIMTSSLSASLAYSIIFIFVLFMIPAGLRFLNAGEKIRRWLAKESHFEFGVRFSFALMAILAAISNEIGFHSIIGAFIAGLIISELTPRASLLEKKLEGFGYGFFIPIFFIVIGAKIKVMELFQGVGNLELLVLVIAAAVFAKLVSVGLASRFAGFTRRESFAMGWIHIARLSLIIAALEIGSELGFLGPDIFSIFMIMALISAVLGPTIGKRLLLRSGNLVA